MNATFSPTVFTVVAIEALCTITNVFIAGNNRAGSVVLAWFVGTQIFYEIKNSFFNVDDMNSNYFNLNF